MVINTRLFARDIKGGIREWNIIYNGNSNTATILSGTLNGNLIETVITHPNITKEVASRIAKKRKEGYSSVKDLGMTTEIGNVIIFNDWLDKVLPAYNSDINNNLKPMKCQKFKENVVKYPAIVQPKLNGVRCVLRWEENEIGEGLFKQTESRAVLRGKIGLEYHMPHITNALTKDDFYLNGRELVYDGELYGHSLPLNFIKSSCPMYNSAGTLSKPSGNPETIEFYIFDLAIPDVIQEDRLDIVLQKSISLVKHKNIQIVPRFYINSDSEALSYRDEFIKMGYEGCVIRETGTEYAFGFRPKYIRKYKTHMDSEFLIVDIIPKPSDSSLPLFVLRNDINDEIFECNPQGDYEWQRDLFDNKEELIGCYAVVRYRERSGVKQVPFHANVIDIRKTKTSDL